MAEKRKKPELESFDDIFTTEMFREELKLEKVRDVSLSELHDFKDHPFHVADDEDMRKMVESIKEFGVLTPAIARPKEGGGYELISGHRRKRACELAGIDRMPVLIRDMDDDRATILMVDSNLQRENILPSERAKAYQMKMEALRHQGQKRELQTGEKLTSRQVVGKLEASDIVGDKSGESGRQVQRYLRLNNLNSNLLEKVDSREIAFNPAVELSFLKPEEQDYLLEAMNSWQATPSLSQAQRLKKFSQEGKCSHDVIDAVLSEEKKKDVDRVVLKTTEISKYFPKSYTPKQMEDTILKLLQKWQRQHQHDVSL
ncbi:ParB/RepB/Spo0J family partition protein [Bilifractor sp. LCP19S3_H10]|uniref:ParB/RepB/Spo0J family partition protein n=1 Tax=Bilifractor porci TaxID=2606636 RepID=A0A7X2PAW0_9FIRM|nr:ParB/RepB/Spo0J family partition protein [Bilifractor porci]MST83001.1 ParB/RepB/Spo0J family partition protein [Bilifractor porci]